MAGRKSLAVVETPTEAWGRKYQRFTCDVEGHEGLWAEVWHNYPQRYRRELLTLEDEPLLEFLKAQRFIQAWNFTDFDGNALSTPSVSDQWLEEVPFEVVQWIWAILIEAPARVWRDRVGKSAMQSDITQ